MSENRTEEEYGRQIKVAVTNESEDGTGTPHVVVTDANGAVKVTAV